jgi:hypothetical protein
VIVNFHATLLVELDDRMKIWSASTCMGDIFAKNVTIDSFSSITNLTHTECILQNDKHLRTYFLSPKLEKKEEE